jgi:hypothetical protein
MMPGIEMESSMKYQANPVMVEAFKIVDVSEMDNEGNVQCALNNGENVVADKDMTARYRPKADD